MLDLFPHGHNIVLYNLHQHLLSHEDLSGGYCPLVLVLGAIKTIDDMDYGAV